MPDTRTIVQEIYSAYERRDFEEFAARLHEDIDWMVFGPMRLFPFQGPRRGRAAVLEALSSIAKDYVLQRYAVETMIVEGDRAAVMSNTAFIQRSTNRTIQLRLANFLRVQDDKLIEFREFADTFDAAEQVLGRFIEVS